MKSWTCILFYLFLYKKFTVKLKVKDTRRPASADRTARRQFQATGQPVSRTQAIDATTSRLPRYEAKCEERTRFQWGSVPLRSVIKGTELPPANTLIPLERQLLALQLWQFLYDLAADFSSFIVEIVQKMTNLGTLSPILKKLGTA